MKRLALFVSFIGLSVIVQAQVLPSSIPAKKIIVNSLTKQNTESSVETKISEISGEIKGFGNDTVFIKSIEVSNTDRSKTDTIVAKNDKFNTILKSSEALICMIYTKHCCITRQNGRLFLPDTKMARIFLLPGKTIEILGILTDKSLSYIAKGDELNLTYSSRRVKSLKKNIELDVFILRIDSMQFKGVEEKTIDKLDEILMSKQNEAMTADREYIKANPGKDLSAYYLSNQPLDSVPIYMKYLDVNVRNGVFGTMLETVNARYKKYKEISEAEKKVVEGTQAPEFSLKSLNGEIVRLSDFKDKYLVIDFWGSWCYWCIKGIPQMKEYYQKYKDRIEFIGIACRDKDDAWRSAIEKYQLNWVQLFNLTVSDVPVLYGVSGYPTKFILDKNHKVVFKVIGEDPIFYKKLDEFMNPEIVK